MLSYAVSHESFPRASPVRKGGCCACLKQKSSISRGAAEAGFTPVNATKVTATNTHFGFKVLAPPLSLTTISNLYKLVLAKMRFLDRPQTSSAH